MALVFRRKLIDNRGFLRESWGIVNRFSNDNAFLNRISKPRDDPPEKDKCLLIFGSFIYTGRHGNKFWFSLSEE